MLGAVLGGIGAAGSILGGREAAKAAEAGQEQAGRLALAQLAEQQRQFGVLAKAGAPYREAGERGLAQYEAYTQDPGAMYEDPAYQALLAQGTQAIEGSAAARGTQLSGRTLAGLQEMGQATASQYRSQIMGELANLANIGSTAIGQAYGIGGQQMAQTGQVYGNLANLAQQTGQIQAGAHIGQAGALANLAGTLGSAYISQPQTGSGGLRGLGGSAIGGVG